MKIKETQVSLEVSSLTQVLSAFLNSENCHLFYLHQEQWTERNCLLFIKKYSEI